MSVSSNRCALWKERAYRFSSEVANSQGSSNIEADLARRPHHVERNEPDEPYFQTYSRRARTSAPFCFTRTSIACEPLEATPFGVKYST